MSKRPLQYLFAYFYIITFLSYDKIVVKCIVEPRERWLRKIYLKILLFLITYNSQNVCCLTQRRNDIKNGEMNVIRINVGRHLDNTIINRLRQNCICSKIQKSTSEKVQFPPPPSLFLSRMKNENRYYSLQFPVTLLCLTYNLIDPWITAGVCKEHAYN